jgi:hypothetical protein
MPTFVFDKVSDVAFPFLSVTACGVALTLFLSCKFTGIVVSTLLWSEQEYHVGAIEEGHLSQILANAITFHVQ